jgi:HSP20 family protein
MSVRDLIPWGRSNDHDQVTTAFRDEDRNPFLSLRRQGEAVL